MRIAVIGAMDPEIDALHELLAEPVSIEIGHWRGQHGRFGPHEILLFKTGVGKVLSAALTQALIMHGAEAVVFTGIAGAVAADLQIGDIIVGSEAIQHDMDATHLAPEFSRGEIPYTGISIVYADAKLLKLALSYVPSDGAKIRSGRILTGDQFLAGNRAQYPHLAELKGDVVEMEGAAVGIVCHFNSIPWVAIRTVSDLSDDNSHTDFHSFLPVAARHSVEVVKLILEKIS